MGSRPEPAVLPPVILFAHHPGSWVPYYGLRGDRERVLAPRYKEVGAIPEEAAGGQLVDVLYQPLVDLEMARAPRRGLSRSNILGRETPHDVHDWRRDRVLSGGR